MEKSPLPPEEKHIKDLRKYLRHSKKAIPGVLIFGALCLAILLLFECFVSAPWWVYGFVLWVVPFGLICDGVNIIYIKRKLRRIDDRTDGVNGTSQPT